MLLLVSVNSNLSVRIAMMSVSLSPAACLLLSSLQTVLCIALKESGFLSGQYCHVQKHSQKSDVWYTQCLKHYSGTQVNNDQMLHICVLMHTHNSVTKCGCCISLSKDCVQVCLVTVKLWSIDTDFLLDATTPPVSCT